MNIFVVNVVLNSCLIFNIYFQDCASNARQIVKTEKKTKEKYHLGHGGLVVAGVSLPGIAGRQPLGVAVEPTEVSVGQVRVAASSIPTPPKLELFGTLWLGGVGQSLWLLMG